MLDGNEGLYVERRLHEPDFKMTGQHFHVYCEIFFLESGSCTYYVENKSYSVEAGNVFIVPPGMSHGTRYHGNQGSVRTVVYCKNDLLGHTFWDEYPEILEKFSHPGRVALVERGKIALKNLLDRMLEENNIPDIYSYKLLRMLMMETLICINRNGIFVRKSDKDAGVPDDDIDTALCYIAENYALPITLGELARKVNLSPVYFSQKFRKVTGITYKDYLNRVRLKQAVQALITTNDSITEIALKCGFNSSNYFKDLFRKTNGVSPREFRKNAALQKETERPDA